MNKIAIIPARGGSKGLPGKNVRPFAGKPLIAWSIESAISSNIFNRVIVSTDCPNIAELSEDLNAEVPFLRPTALASDTARTVDTVLHLISQLQLKGTDFICLLQPTSPLREASDIVSSLALMERECASSAIAVTRFKLAIEWVMEMNQSGELLLPKVDSIPTNRQESKPHFFPNGAIYWSQVCAIKEQKSFWTSKTVGYEMDCWKSVDIDSLKDFLVAEFLLRQRD